SNQILCTGPLDFPPLIDGFVPRGGRWVRSGSGWLRFARRALGSFGERLASFRAEGAGFVRGTTATPRPSQGPVGFVPPRPTPHAPCTTPLPGRVAKGHLGRRGP